MGKKMFSVPVGEAKEGETAPRHNVGAKNGLWKTPDNIPEITTIYSLLQWAVKQYGSKSAMGWRTIVDIHEETKEVTKTVDGQEQTVEKKWQYFELSPYKYISFNQLANVVSDYAAGLIHIGIKPSGEERFHIYAQTSAQWLQTAFACNSQGIPCVTAYDTLGEEGLTHSLLQTETVGIFCDNDILHTLARPLQKATSIRVVVCRDDIADPESDPSVQAILDARPDVKIYSYNQVIALGKENPVPANPPKPEDTALIMYTSGSTGTPKGVVLLNKTVVAGVAGATGNIPRKWINTKDRLLAFLPLAHILEFTFELACIFWGGTLGYGTVKTISDVSVKNCVGDIREFKPTIMVGVPAVWENVKKGILHKVKENPSMVQKIFWGAYHTKQKLSSLGIPVPFVDNLIFKKVKDATGGCLRLTLNGGAPLAADTQEFLSTLICPLLIGYGLTETNANTTLMTPTSFEIGCQGEPTHGVAIKLIDVPDAGYFAKNNQGEILVKGDPVSPHYFNNEEETKKSYTEDGWFMTGDIGEWTENGMIRIVDRKKNLVKTLNGEYIAIEKLESTYRSNSFVSNICVYADQSKVKPVAIVVPRDQAVNTLCKELGIDFHEEVAHEPQVVKAIHKSLLETGKNLGLKGVELISGVVISSIEWTPQNGYLTSAQKLQRKLIVNDNKEDIDRVYEQNP